MGLETIALLILWTATGFFFMVVFNRDCRSTLGYFALALFCGPAVWLVLAAFFIEWFLIGMRERIRRFPR